MKKQIRRFPRRAIVRNVADGIGFLSIIITTIAFIYIYNGFS
ncbi:MAG: hypothetical protein OXD33_13000 [Rhodobacteraceae bacterium]|nr:hypothetical protein [Paracoccaceae bacterium]